MKRNHWGGMDKGTANKKHRREMLLCCTLSTRYVSGKVFSCLFFFLWWNWVHQCVSGLSHPFLSRGLQPTTRWTEWAQAWVKEETGLFEEFVLNISALRGKENCCWLLFSLVWGRSCPTSRLKSRTESSQKKLRRPYSHFRFEFFPSDKKKAVNEVNNFVGGHVMKMSEST